MALVKKGMPVGLIDRDALVLAELAQTLKSESTAPVAFAAVDVTDRAGLFAAVNRLSAEIGPFDVLVACAGIGSLTLVPELDTATLARRLKSIGRRRPIDRGRSAQNDRARSGPHRGHRQHGRLSRLPLDDLLLRIKSGPDRLPRGHAPGFAAAV